jgi:hypothetical protein
MIGFKQGIVSEAIPARDSQITPEIDLRISTQRGTITANPLIPPQFPDAVLCRTKWLKVGSASSGTPTGQLLYEHLSAGSLLTIDVDQPSLVGHGAEPLPIRDRPPESLRWFNASFEARRKPGSVVLLMDDEHRAVRVFEHVMRH